MDAIIPGKVSEDTAGSIRAIEQNTKAWDPPLSLERTIHIVPILHPGYIVRGRWAQEEAQVLYLLRAKEISEDDGFKLQDPYEPPPNAILDPTLLDMYTWREELLAMGGGCSVDIETAGEYIRIIGFCRIADLVSIVIAFRTQGGEPKWTNWTEFELIVKWTYDTLADPEIPKYFHNGQSFDVPLLRSYGFEVNNYADDPLLMMRSAYPEMRRGLEVMSKLLLGVPGWKHTIKAEAEGEDK
jgi:hypothetical protein